MATMDGVTMVTTANCAGHYQRLQRHDHGNPSAGLWVDGDVLSIKMFES